MHQPIDDSPRVLSRSIAWQKLICHEHPRLQGVDQLIWLDADIIINLLAPDPLLQANPEKINGCLEFHWGRDSQLESIVNSRQNQQILTFQEQYSGHRFTSYSQLWGFGDGAGPLINTGFLLFNPARHACLLRDDYDHCDDADGMLWGEMVPFSEEIHRAGLFHLIDPRYNHLILLFLAAMMFRALNDNYFLHFAGFKFPEMRFMIGARWDEVNGFCPNAATIVAVVRPSLEAHGLSMLDDC